MKLPPLYHKSKNGQLRSWSVSVKGDTLYFEAGLVDGQKVITNRVAKPKNIGRANETTAEQQAIFEAKSAWENKLARKYSEKPEDAQKDLLLPMLAHTFSEKKVKYPCLAQPKLDGVRCLAFWDDDKVKLISRAGKEWLATNHVNKALEAILPKDAMFDGELYTHGYSCQTITSYVKKECEETQNIEFWVYDMPIVAGDDSLDFVDRYRELNKLLADCVKPLVLVHTMPIGNPVTKAATAMAHLEKGFEGSIIRNHDGKYLWGYRSYDLLKVKEFQDAEFEVVGWKEGVGTNVGCCTFLLKNDVSEATFEAAMKAPLEERRRYWDERENYMGKMLKVKFFDRTDAGIPRFPIGLMFRPEEDR